MSEVGYAKPAVFARQQKSRRTHADDNGDSGELLDNRLILPLIQVAVPITGVRAACDAVEMSATMTRQGRN